MMTKAQLEVEVKKLTEERSLLLRQIKNLKKNRAADPTKTTIFKALESDCLELAKLVELKKELLDIKERKINTFIEFSWFERLFFSKEDIKRLL